MDTPRLEGSRQLYQPIIIRLVLVSSLITRFRDQWAPSFPRKSASVFSFQGLRRRRKPEFDNRRYTIPIIAFLDGPPSRLTRRTNLLIYESVDIRIAFLLQLNLSQTSAKPRPRKRTFRIFAGFYTFHPLFPQPLVMSPYYPYLAYATPSTGHVFVAGWLAVVHEQGR